MNERLEARAENVLRNAYALARRTRAYRGMCLWGFVSDMTGHGSTYSKEICRDLGWNPDAEVGKYKLPNLRATDQQKVAP